MESIKVTSEIAALKKVLIHSPDGGIGSIIPSKFKDWLYDDTVDLKKMQKEYDDYLKILLYFLDPEKMVAINAYKEKCATALDTEDYRNIFKPCHKDYFASDKVIDVQYRLSIILQEPLIKTRLISAICAIEGCSFAIESQLNALDAVALAKTFITGSISNKTNGEENTFIFPPLPNLIFTRDIGITINDFILLSKTAKLARKRESLLAKFIFYYDLFKADPSKVLELTEDSDFFLEDELVQKENLITIEGGDVMMIGTNHLIVGCSERTSPSGVNAIINAVFSNKATGIEYVTVIKIAEDRAQMHIDTIFTQISKSAWIIHTSFSETIREEKQKKEFNRTQSLKNGKLAEDETVKIFQYYKPIQSDFNQGKEYLYDNKDIKGLEKFLISISERDYNVQERDVKIIYSGNKKFPHDEREQWTDACNLLAIKEGVVIGYDRNEKTAHAFKEHLNYDVVRAKDLIKDFENGTRTPADVKNTLILLPSSELSRARGGSHCMSMPLLRE
jgi:arginine deiminase